MAAIFLLLAQPWKKVIKKKRYIVGSQVPLPAILKLEYGSSAVGVKQVKTLQEAKAFVQHVQNTLQSEKDHPGVGLGHSRSFVLMSRLEGTEHDVDLAMFEGQVMAAFVSDNGPTRLPVCSETTAAMPSVLNKGELQYVLYNWRRGIS